MYAKLNTQQINLLKLARNLDDDTRSSIRAEVFALAKAQFGIPVEHKVRVEIDDQTSPDFAVIVRKKDDTKYPAVQATATQATGVAAHRPPETRWFNIDIGGYIEGYVAELDWDDGLGHLTADDDGVEPNYFGVEGYPCAVTSGGEMFVQLREDQL